MPRGIFVPVDRTGIPAERETGEGQKRSGTHTMEKKETGCGWEWRRCCAPFLRRGCWSLLSVDSFVASFSYGANHIRMPFRSVACISGICSGSLGLSLLVGRGLRSYLPEGVLPWLCFLLLAGLGIVKIFDSSLKALIRRHRDLHRQWQFSAFHFRVILNIYANPEQADQDRSGVLSVGEATALAVALSLDSLTVGVGAGLDQTPVFAAVLISFVLGLAAILLGRWLGDKLMRGLQIEVSWISGLMLLVLAGLKLV